MTENFRLENYEEEIEKKIRKDIMDKNPNTEIGWCLEKDINKILHYLYVNPIGIFDWTIDNQMALRFARKVDAESLVAIVEDADRICEHMWL